MIRDLLTPDAQADPYAWASVLVAHAAIGAAGWAALSWWSVAAYLVFEAVQAAVARRALYWDSILDAYGFSFGALLTSGLWLHDGLQIGGAVTCCAAIAFAGWRARA